MTNFANTWLPNIVCTFGGIIVSGAIGYWQGSKASRISAQHTAMLTNLLIVMEEQGHLKLVRDAKGVVTGGRAYEIQLGSAHMAFNRPTGTQSPPANDE